MQTFLSALSDIENQEIMPLRAPTLDPTIRALEKLKVQYPSDLKRVILVAGTNGKGTTSAALAKLISATGKSVGLYTSPHLASICERIRINGQDISEDDFGNLYFEIKEKLLPQRLSHFEMLTVMAAYYFFNIKKVDYAIFEVGMGGTWDATNAIPHGVALIAKLGFDHQHLLGGTLNEIAKNKFGITSKNGIVCSLEIPSELRPLMEDVKLETACLWTEAPIFDFKVKPGLPPKYSIFTKWGEIDLKILGHRGLENLNLALTAFEKLGFDATQYLEALGDFEWTGRMTEFSFEGQKCRAFISGDHNGQGVESLVEILNNCTFKNLRVVTGVGQKKDLNEILEPIMKIAGGKNIFMTTANFMGRGPEELEPFLSQSMGYFEKPIEALRVANQMCGSDDLLLVTGSLYLVGDILNEIKNTAAPQIN